MHTVAQNGTTLDVIEKNILQKLPKVDHTTMYNVFIGFIQNLVLLIFALECPWVAWERL